MKKLLNQKQEKEICNMYVKGVPTISISIKYEVSVDTIRRVLARHKILKTKLTLNCKKDVFNHIKKKKNGCWEWQLSLNSGYGQFTINGKTYAAHRLAYEVYTEKEIPEGMCVCHECDNPKCINPDHLFLGTNLDNIKDRGNKGRSTKGENIHTAILTADDVLRIRKSYKRGITKQKDIAKIYGVSQFSVSSIIRRTTWKHI